MSQSSSNPFSITVKAAVLRPPPAWVPPAGYFADVPMRNFPKDVAPSIYINDGYLMNTPFVMWGGSAFLRDYSELGAQVYYSGGHESALAAPNIQMTLICDFSSLLWSTANVPVAQNAANTFVNGYAADGTAYVPHSYSGLQELPLAWGGASKGTLMSFFWAGSQNLNRINLMDVSKTTHGYSKMATRQPQNADPTAIRFAPTTAGGNYPITVMDEARQGWWAAVLGRVSYTLFVSKTGEITQYPALGGNLVNGTMVLCPSLNLLIALDGGYASGPNAGSTYRAMYIRNLATGVVTRNSTLGTVPALDDGYDGGTDNFNYLDGMGLQWVDELGCIIGLDQTQTPPAVVKLSPPALNPASTPWTWSKVAVQHWPNDVGGQATLQTVQANYWSKFLWVPTLRAFVFATDRARKPQVLKLS